MAGRALLLGISLLLGALVQAVPLAAQSTVVVLARHAETAAGPVGDPVLSGAGAERAAALAAAAADADLAAVFTTHYARTRQTAEPAAAASGATRHVVQVQREARDLHIREIAERILRDYRGRTVLVVGHSNTVPQLILALGGPAVPAIADTEYDRLYTLVIDAGVVRLVAGRYGD